MNRNERRQRGLDMFASQARIIQLGSIWKNPLTNRLNRMTKDDLLHIDRVQRSQHNNDSLLSNDERRKLEVSEHMKYGNCRWI